MYLLLCLCDVIVNCWSVSPRIEGDEPLYRSVTVGESVELRCNATGSPTPRVIWQKGTRILTETVGLLFLP